MDQKFVVIDSRIACRLFKDKDIPVVELLSKKLKKNKVKEQFTCATTQSYVSNFNMAYSKKTNEKYFRGCFSTHGIKLIGADGDDVKCSEYLSQSGRECIECARVNNGCVVSNDSKVLSVARNMGIISYSLDDFVETI